MPKAAIYKQRNFLSAEDEIRLAIYPLATTPASDAVFLEYYDQL